MDLTGIGNMLSGAGAGLQGHGEIWRKNRMLEEQMRYDRERTDRLDNLAIQQAEQERRQLAAMERRKTLFTDAEGALNLVNTGRFDQAAMLFRSRLQFAQQHPGVDFSDTERLYSMSVAAAQGDEQAQQALKVDLENGVAIGRGLGILEKRKSDNDNASAKTTHYDNGTVMMTLPDHSRVVIAPNGQPVEGDEAARVIEQARKEQVTHTGDKAVAGARGKANEARAQEVIDFGLDAANGLPIINRGIELLGMVETGGWDAAAIRAKQAFGIESGNEAELASNLGRAVLSQLRATFGAQFTEREGEKLDRIEANLGKSTAGNMRLLKQLKRMAEKHIQKAITRANKVGDFDTVRELTEMREFSLSMPEPDTAPKQGSGGGIKVLSIEPGR